MERATMTQNLNSEQISSILTEIGDVEMPFVGEFDFYVYPNDPVSISDDVINFYDPELKAVLKASLESKINEFTDLNHKLDRDKVYLKVATENGVKRDYEGHERQKDLIKMYWWWTWKVWSEQDILKLKALAKQIRNLTLADNQIKKLDPNYKEQNKKGWYTYSDIEEANSIPIIELVNDKVRRSGNKYIVACPFHKEKTGSFFVYDDGTFHCFGCGAHGNNTVDFVRKRDNLSFTDAMKFLIGR